MPILPKNELTPNELFLKIEAANSEWELNLIRNQILQYQYSLFNGCTLSPNEADLLRSYKMLLSLPIKQTKLSKEEAQELRSVW
jgi:hypothetical protein